MSRNEIGVMREVFFSSTQSALVSPTATSVLTSTLLPATQQVTQQSSTNNATATFIPSSVEATPTSTEQPQVVSDCLSTDYIPEITGFHPPIDTLICIPSDVFVYVSSDPAKISIPSINYDISFTVGYTFKFFGPVKFIISGVLTKNIWMEVSYDTNNLNKLDEKALNLVYQDGKVCDLALYTGSACP